MPNELGSPDQPRNGKDDVAVMRESIRLRCMQSVHSLVPMSSALVATGALLWSFCPVGPLIAWLLTSFGMTVMRAGVCRRILLRVAEAPDEALPQYNRQLLISGVAMSLTSGAGIWWVGI